MEIASIIVILHCRSDQLQVVNIIDLTLTMRSRELWVVNSNSNSEDVVTINRNLSGTVGGHICSH